MNELNSLEEFALQKGFILDNKIVKPIKEMRNTMCAKDTSQPNADQPPAGASGGKEEYILFLRKGGV